ncbi:MAG: winged helix-turn-helix domain-containing protein [Nitrospirota bacterium]
MLNKIFSSQTRVGVLSFLFEHLGERFYIREIAKSIGKNVSGVKRELDNLEKIGLLISEKKGNLKYFYVNEESSLCPEIKNIILKTIGVQETVKKMLKKQKGILKGFIYGGFAKGFMGSTMPIDLMIVGKPDLSELSVAISNLEEKLKRKISFHVLDEEEYNKKINEGEPFLSEILSGKKIVLIGG